MNIAILERSVDAALRVTPDDAPEAPALRDLAVRARKLARAWSRPQCLGLFGPSQAGKSFLVGALLAHELGTLKVVGGRGTTLDFLKEINPAKGVESTGVVTRFSTRPAPALTSGDFECQLLPLEVVLESLATGFLVECTSPPVDAERIDRVLRDAKVQAGAPASAVYAQAWDAAWHGLTKKYQDRHPYLNDLRRHATLAHGAWKKDVKSAAGWQHVYTLLWGGAGYAADLDRLIGVLLAGLEQVGHATRVEVGLEHVRAASEGASVIDAACLNSLGTGKPAVTVTVSDGTRAGSRVSVEPGVLSALIAEIRLPLAPVPGSLLDRADILDFPGGRALKGINGFGPQELNTGKLDHAIEVYKRGKLTFLFEQYAIDREITALVLCSPGPTKPEAVQLQSQVESWLRIRHNGGPVPPSEIAAPSLFVALTKFDMSLGALRSDNARDRWDSRVQEACVDFWARSQGSWLGNWGARGQPFTNMFWVRNPYADQMKTLKPGEADYETVKQGYLESRAVARHVKDPIVKWAAVEGDDEKGLPKSGVPLLAAALRERLAEDVKAKELAAEAEAVKSELASVLRAMTPSKDEAEQRARLLEEAKALAEAVEREMTRRCSGAVFGEFVRLLVPPEPAIEAEVRKAWAQAAPMSIKVSDKVKKVLVQVLLWWMADAAERVRASTLSLPVGLVDRFVREVCTSKRLMPVLGQATFPYFSRTVVDTTLVAKVLHVKVSDALVDLFTPRDRATPALPVHLSGAEVASAAAEDAGAVDWSNVDFGAEGAPPPSSTTANAGLEIVFAGAKHFAHWKGSLADFYLQNAGGRAQMAAEDPRVVELVRVLRQVEG